MKEYVHLLPTFQQISSSVDGDENVILRSLHNYDGYISKASLRPLYNEYGNVYIVVDMELKGRIREALMQMISNFEVEAKGCENITNASFREKNKKKYISKCLVFLSITFV